MKKKLLLDEKYCKHCHTIARMKSYFYQIQTKNITLGGYILLDNNLKYSEINKLLLENKNIFCIKN